MARHVDWMARLMQAVETAQVLPFRYGLHDCCTFAAYCVDAQREDSRIGELMQRHHPYANEEEAYEYIETQGGLTGLVTHYLGEPMENPKFAAPGDVALTRNRDGREIVGIIVGHNVVVPGSHGLVTFSVEGLLAAWSV